MKQQTITMFVSFALALGGAGCGGKKDDGGAGDKNAASCAQAAANYVALEQSSKLPTVFTRLNPTPAQVQALTALVQGHCETGKFEQYGNQLSDKPWSGATRTCVAGAKAGEKMGDSPVDDCFKKMGRGYSLQVAQIVDSFAKDEAAKAAATPPPPPPPPAEPPPADPAAPATGDPAAPAAPATGDTPAPAPAAGDSPGSAAPSAAPASKT